MITSEIELLKILADGEMHSGEELAKTFGVSRTAIWKQLNKLKEKYIDIKSIKGKGYQLVNPIELLDDAKIIGQLNPDIQGHLQSLQLLYQTTSTNQILMDRIFDGPINGHVVLAEYQTKGRGRGSNKWLSGLGAGLYLSVGWRFDFLPNTFSALSLATGVVLAKSMEQLCSVRVQLKWPNDLVYNGAKLGGILIESHSQHAGIVDVVIGIGINIRLPSQLSEQIPYQTADLVRIADHLPSRNMLAGIIINNLFELLSTYSVQGFEHYIDDWRELDLCRGKQAELQLADSRIEGTVIDIDDYGYLLMLVAGKQVKYGSGDLTLRLLN